MIELSRAKGSKLRIFCLGDRLFFSSDFLMLQISLNAWVGLWQQVNLCLACLDKIGHSLFFQECLKWKVEWWHCVQTAEHLRNHLSSKFDLSWKFMKNIWILCRFESSCKAHFVATIGTNSCLFSCLFERHKRQFKETQIEVTPFLLPNISSRLHAVDQLPRLPRWAVRM